MEFSKAKTAGSVSTADRFGNIVRIIALLFTVIATGLLSYFVWHLNMDSMSVPGEFIVLLFTSSLTTSAHLVVLALNRRSSSGERRLLNSGRSLTLHTVLLALWIAGIAIFATKIGHMALRASCDVSMWQTETGVLVCRLYKALFASLVLSALGVLGLAGLDLQAWLANAHSVKGDAGSYRDIKSGKKRWFGTAVLGGRAKKQHMDSGAGYEGFSSSSQMSDGLSTLTAAATSTTQDKSPKDVDS